MTTLDRPLRVLIVAADPLARSGLRALLSEQSELTVAGLTTPGGLSSALDAFQPDVVLWDCAWSPDPSPEPILDLVAAVGTGPTPEPPVVALVVDRDQGRALWQAGLRSVLMRTVTPEALAAGLRAAAAGLWTLSSDLAAAIPVLRGEVRGDAIEPLTDRELQVLQLMAEGLANRAIAQRLTISEHTVKYHINLIFAKLGAQSRTDAVVRATRAGLILI